MRFNILKKSLFLVLIASFLSCDRELNDIGSEAIGENHFGMTKIELDIKSYNQPISVANTTNLSVNSLGVYENAMGKTVAHFVSQVELASTTTNIVNPASAVIENVYLEVPYSSTQTDLTTDAPKYLINNLYPKNEEPAHITNKFKLSVFENGYDLRVSNTEGQEIYINEKNKFLPFLKGTDAAGNSVIGGTRLNDDANTAENDAFFFNNAFVTDEDYVSTTVPTPTSKVAPKMKIKLNKNYFKKKIFENSTLLNNQDVFKNHFKGLYFQVEEIAGNKSLALLNFADSKIIIQYKDEVSTGVFTKKQYIINVKGITASLQDFTPKPEFANAKPPTEEADFLYQKAGAGASMSIVGINKSSTTFQNLLALKDKIVINDAYLEYYIDKSFYGAFGTTEEEKTELNDLNNPYRSVAYNVPNESTLLDFQYDNSTVSNNRLLDKNIFGGILSKKNDEYFYKVRVTQHIIDLIKNEDAKNVSIGLIATNDINSFGTGSSVFKSKLKNTIGSLPTFTSSNNDLIMEESFSGKRKIENIPAATMNVPVGAKIYGTAHSDATKKMKLIVYYTLKD